MNSNFPCFRPGCKGKPRPVVYGFATGTKHCIECDQCGITTALFEHEDNAWANWEYRPGQMQTMIYQVANSDDLQILSPRLKVVDGEIFAEEEEAFIEF